MIVAFLGLVIFDMIQNYAEPNAACDDEQTTLAAKPELIAQQDAAVACHDEAIATPAKPVEQERVFRISAETLAENKRGLHCFVVD